MSTREDRVLGTLSAKPKSRYEIAKALGISERDVRKSIEIMRNRGVPICSNSRMGGYWIGNSLDCKRAAAEYRARAKKMLHTASMLEGQIAGQLEMGDFNVVV